MNDINTGGPAFPIDTYDTELNKIIQSHGMNLRDYFAAKAMQALIEKYSHEGDISRNAYKMADAMLSARGTVKARES